MMKYFKTSEIAKAVGVHPNTVRLYEEWGLLQPVPRKENGYRLYTGEHLEQMRLCRIALRCEYVEGNIREMATLLIKKAAKGNLQEALTDAYEYLKHIRCELVRAEEAVSLIQRWINGEMEVEKEIYLKRMDVATRLGVSIDVLRNWERNGLIEIPRNCRNGYREYGPGEINRLKIIRTLRAANYSMMAIFRMMTRIDQGQKENIGEILNTPRPEEEIVSAADRWIHTLTETEQDAGEVILQLKKMLTLH